MSDTKRPFNSPIFDPSWNVEIPHPALRRVPTQVASAPRRAPEMMASDDASAIPLAPAFGTQSTVSPDALAKWALAQESVLPHTPEDTALTGNLWKDLGSEMGATGYSALNQFLMGLPDFLVKHSSGPAYEKLHDYLTKHATAAREGDLLGLGASMLTGKGELQLLSKIPGIAGKAAKFALGNGGGVLKTAARGALAAAPQSLVRAATGNITPEQGLAGLGLGALAGGIAGAIAPKNLAPILSEGATNLPGPARRAIDYLKHMNDQTLLGALGGNGSMVRSTASFGLRANQLMSRAAREKHIIQRAADIVAEDHITGEAKLLQSLQLRDRLPWNAIDNAYTGTKLGQFNDEILNLPNVRKYVGKATTAITPQDVRADLRRAIGPRASDMVETGNGPLTETERRIAAELNVPVSGHKTTANGQRILDILKNADEMDGLPDIQNYLDSDFINIHPKGAGTSELKRLRDAAIEIKKFAQQKGIDQAVENGTLSPEQAENFIADYPAIVLLKRIAENKAKQLFGAAPGSDTAIKSLLAAGPVAGGALGYERSDDKNKLAGTLAGIAGGAALGGLGGNLLNQMLTKGTNAGMLRGALGVRKALGKIAGGAANDAQQEATGLPGLAAAAGAIPPRSGALEALLGHQTNPAEPAETPNEAGITGIPAVPENITWAQLQENKSPYLREIARQIRNMYGQQYFFTRNPDGSHVTLTELTQKLAKDTNGFKDVPQVAQEILFYNQPQEIPAFIGAYNTGQILGGVNYKDIIDALKPVTQGGKYAGLGLSPKGNPVGNALLRMNPQEREVLTQINQLAHIAGVDPAVAVADIQRIAGNPRLSDEQKEAQIKDYYLRLYPQINGHPYNPGVLQALGLPSGM